MKFGIKSLARLLLRQAASGRNLITRGDDRFIVSYPKSGNTWMRFLIANLVSEDVGFRSIERIIPDIYHHSGLRLSHYDSPRILKSHECFDPRYPRTIYIVRDPREVVISYFYHHKKFQHKYGAMPLSDFVKAFLEGRLDKFGSWNQNVGSWIGASQGDPNFMLIRYEDLKHNTEQLLTNVADHFGIVRDIDAIVKSVHRCEFSRMQDMEKSQGYKWKALAGTRQDMSFVRKGEIGSWRNLLSTNDVRKIEEECRHLMLQLGYL